VSATSGIHKLRRRVVLLSALIAASLLASFVLGGSTSPERAAPIRSLPTLAEVPAAIPAGGVSVSTVVLMPPGPTDANTMSMREALDVARGPRNRRLDAKAVLARVTVPGTIPPPDSPVPFRTIADRLAWVVTFTFPRAIPVGSAGSQSKVVSSDTRPTAKQFNIMLDADSAEFLLGFYTK
jgi:hypothetical protein